MASPSLSEKHLEPCLLEVVVGRQGLGETVLPHDHEGSAVCERPRFVRAAGVQPQSSFQQVRRSRDDSAQGIVPQILDQFHEHPARVAAAESVA
jgi:hypothetical protein